MSHDALTIDGSTGEGGGQILRTSLAMSLVTGRPFRIVNIRAARKKPGLQRQHLTAVMAARRIGRARVEGADVGSLELTFTPQAVVAGDYSFDVGSAGSTTLVAQTILPALLRVPEVSKVSIHGGTHNPFAPPFDFLAGSFLPLVNRMGPNVEATLIRPGFYPAGGGEVVMAVGPSATLTPFDLLERGQVLRRRGRALVSALPVHIAERELAVIHERLGWSHDELTVEEITAPRGPGNVVVLEIQCAHVTEVVTAFGARGVRAETVAQRAAEAAERYLQSDVPVGEHLADQLLIPLAMAGGGSFRTTRPTLHTITNIEAVEQFLPVRIAVQQSSDPSWDVAVHPS